MFGDVEGGGWAAAAWPSATRTPPQPFGRTPHRRFVDGIPHRQRSGLPWRDLPVCIGKRRSVYERHRRRSSIVPGSEVPARKVDVWSGEREKDLASACARLPSLRSATRQPCWWRPSTGGYDWPRHAPGR
ncbi:transposase [Streptomyces mirabilis]|uniref:transposase n=1 Tax=Streptomyces mirabilis TaxID=68239 RepID=UPI00367C9021